MSGLGRAAVIAVAAFAAACGQKGPPLAPLHLIPASPANVVISRVAGEARLRFDVPSTNLNGPGPVAIDRVEIYAATVAAGAAKPSNRELLSAKYRVGTIPVKPPPVEGEAPVENAPPDNRPAAGEHATFVEALSEEKLRPVFTTPAKPVTAAAAPSAPPAPTAPAGANAAAPAAVTPGAAAPAAPAPGAAPPATVPPTTAPLVGAPQTAAPPAAVTPDVQVPGTLLPIPALPPVAAPPVADTPKYAVRVYAVRGLTKSGRPGQPAARVELPVIAPPPAPAAPAATPTETAVVLTWLPPVAEGAVAFNVYKAGGVDPINAAPISEPKYERTGVEFGTEECFVVRALQKVGAISLESDLSPGVCVTPRDTFPPAAPKGLSAVAGQGTMNLSWDANTDRDLAGYLVLRGEAPGDTLRPLTPAPIAATSYEDKSVRPGVRYVYAIVAVDKASPPNTSAQSTRVEETAR